MLRRIGAKATSRSGWIGQWGSHMKGAVFKKLLPRHKVNHLPGSFCIGRKDNLWRSIYRMQSEHGRDSFDFLPECFILPRDRRKLKAAYDSASQGSKWIVKPVASARGIGIRVVDKWADLPKEKHVLVQRYLANPYGMANHPEHELWGWL